MRLSLTLLLFAAALPLWGALSARGDEPAAAASASSKAELTALLFYATDSDGAEASPRANDTAGDTEKLTASLKKVFPAVHYFLLGRHTAPASEKYPVWLMPSPQFPLQIENTGSTADGGLNLYWKLWQKEPLPVKDRELVKSNTILTKAAPIIIGGPKWRQGRLIFVVRME